MEGAVVTQNRKTWQDAKAVAVGVSPHLSILFHHHRASCFLLHEEKERPTPPADFQTLEAGHERLTKTSVWHTRATYWENNPRK